MYAPLPNGVPLLLSMLMACDAVTFRANFKDREPALLYEAKQLTEVPSSNEQLVVLNYNIKCRSSTKIQNNKVISIID